jgi:hypothetical protein
MVSDFIAIRRAEGAAAAGGLDDLAGGDRA